MDNPTNDLKTLKKLFLQFKRSKVEESSSSSKCLFLISNVDIIASPMLAKQKSFKRINVSMMSCSLFLQRISRKKYFTEERLVDSNLKRCLSVLDLTALGVGSTLGLGIYVLAGDVARETAGPSVVISFFIAAIASAFAGICYAEFGSRVPRAGSAYVYSYVTVGEFIGFVIGWNLILEYIIGAASVARGYSSYFDSLIGNVMSEAFQKYMPINLKGIAQYPDFFACGMTLVLTVILAIGVQESTKFNNVFTAINLLVVIFVIICGAFKCDPHNWKIPKDEIPPDAKGKEGGFFPFGLAGVIGGAATCFYGFVGFDAIATTGEEAKNPQKSIPIAIILSLFIIFVAYCGISIVLTMMVPYYLQDKSAPIPSAFLAVGYPVAKWIVSIGALFGLSTSLLGSMFPLPRVLYAMSNDGLIFRFLSRINSRFQTPFIATLLAGTLAAIMTLIFDLNALVDMMSIGTLLAYTLVAISVLILRYQPDDVEINVNEDLSGDSNWQQHDYHKSSIGRQLLNLDRIDQPTALTSTIVKCLTALLGIFLIGFNLFLIYAMDAMYSHKRWAIAGTVIVGILSLICLVLIALQPTNKKALAFKVPWVPLIPALSVWVNTQLMLKLSMYTWIRFSIWMAIGLVIYLGYGIRHSSEEYRTRGVPLRSCQFACSNNGDDEEIEPMIHSSN